MDSVLRRSWTALKRCLPKRLKTYIKSKLGIVTLDPLSRELPLPAGVSEEELRSFLNTICVADSTPRIMASYCGEAFRRFLHTYGLVRDLKGKCLELGANPYFITLLLGQFTSLQMVLANYFGPHLTTPTIIQEVLYMDFKTQKPRRQCFTSSHFNIEEDPFPFPDQEFEAVLFCEIIEHLLMDPAAVLREIKRILKPWGALILTTPNVCRLENVARMIAGVNLYDPYSGYGPYGRHNREYNQRDLCLLLEYLGFTIEEQFTADVHPNWMDKAVPVQKYARFLKKRDNDLGQYIFIRARNDLNRAAGKKKPAFLYRSYPLEELEV
jgi:SAM-dependent methyltransferase